MFSALRDAGFQIELHSHAAAILGVDFPEVAAQLEAILLASAIPIEEIVGSGGGETKDTQRLRRALHDHGWRKHKFEVTRSIDSVARESLLPRGLVTFGDAAGAAHLDDEAPGSVE